MQYRKPKQQKEAIAAHKLISLMRVKGWLVMKLGAGKYVSGWPDYYAVHPRWGCKWFETKAKGSKLRSTQRERFARMTKYGDKIWVLEGAETYMKLFQDPNWREYR